MIVLDQRESALKCTICDETEGIDERAMANPRLLLLRTDLMAIDHSGCEEYENDPHRAKIERGYATRMRALIRGIE